MEWDRGDGVSEWRIERASEISELDASFPARALEWIPDCASMGYMDPSEAMKDWMCGAWGNYVSNIFFSGGRLPGGGDIKSGISAEHAHKAILTVQAALGSYAPSHEHKICACAWILAQHFDGPPDVRD